MAGTYPHDPEQPNVTGSEPAQGFAAPEAARAFSRPETTEDTRSTAPRTMSEIDPERTRDDDLAALKARIAQLEQEGEARDAAARRASQLSENGYAEGGEPIEHFHRLIDGTIVRAFGTATHIADGDKPPLPVVESYAVPPQYDDHYDAVAPNRGER